MREELRQFKRSLEKFVRTKPNLRNLIVDCAASELAVTNTLCKGFTIYSEQRVDLTRNPYEIFLRISRPLNAKTLLQYCILSWYLPDLSKFELQESLRKECTQNLDFYDYQIYLMSEDLMLAALLQETHVSRRTLFGNILTGTMSVKMLGTDGTSKVRQRPLILRLGIKVSPEPRRKIRRRGYNDHGSRAPQDLLDLRNEVRIDQGLTDLQNTLELRRTRAAINLHNLAIRLTGTLLGSG